MVNYLPTYIRSMPCLELPVVNPIVITSHFSAAGFPEGNFTKPSFASGYAANGKPSYSDSKKRTANFYFNGGYSYDNRYLLDVNFRADGSSVFGSNKQFTTTWAIGLAWNLHNEGFIKNNTNFFLDAKVEGFNR